MSQTVSKRQLFDWLAGVFQEDPASITIDRARETIPTWDSMGTLLLIAELDDRLQVTLTEDDLKGLASVRDIVDAIRNKQVEVTD
jgi:acyl carrier protein